MSLSKTTHLILLSLSFFLAMPAYAKNSSTPYIVQLNKTRILHLNQSAETIIVGNPNIADVTIHSDNTIFLVGHRYGLTNLIVLNPMGDTIINTDIQVIAPNSNNQVQVYSGTNRRSYSCTPNCLPAPILGDEPAFSDNNMPDPITLSASESDTTLDLSNISDF